MDKTWNFMNRKLGWFALLLCAWVCTPSAPVLAELPKRPLGGIYDEPNLLSLKTTKTIERIIAEHQKLTQESILLAIWKNNPDGGVEAATRDTFHEWKRETVKPTNVVLIGVDAKSGEISIEVGIGLEQLLDQGEVDRIRKKYFIPEYREGAIDRPFYLTLLEVLKVLESPLVENGIAQAWIKEAGFPGSFTPVSVKKQGNSWWIWILLGVIGMSGVFFVVLSSEAHYTASGWSRVRRFPFLKRLLGKKNKVGGLITGGGVSGSW